MLGVWHAPTSISTTPLVVASEALDLDDARALRGSGWDGDLDESRANRDG